MSAKEVVDRNVPFSRKLKPGNGRQRRRSENPVQQDLPITGVPPVRVEMAICKTGDFRECSQRIFEDCKKDE